MPPFYIGHTKVSKIEEGYRGSVGSKKYKKIWLHELKNNPHLFKTKVISIHETRKEAVLKESYFHKSLNVLGEMYINESISKGSFFVFNRTKEHTKAIIDSRIGYSHSKETRNKISKSKKGKGYPSRIGKSVSEETKSKISNKLTGRLLSEETKEKMKISKVGFKHTEETKLKMKKPKSDRAKENMKKCENPRTCGKLVVNNGKNEKFVNPLDLNLFIEKGWKRGKLIKPKPPSQKGKIYVTNGINNKMISKSEDIPDGWFRGKTNLVKH